MSEVFSATGDHPERVSRFEIREVLGRGAMGVVYRAHDPVLERDLALKLIKPERAGEERNRARFLRECRAAATINHPGVATIYEAGETGEGLLYLASELVEGETLKEAVDRGPLGPARVIEIGIQLAEALEAAHARGAIHRDIKPTNVMLTGDGRIKVLDFGLARLVRAESDDEMSVSDTAELRSVDQTQEGAVVGTPAYMSPEQAAAMKVDERTDVFSAGCVLYELATGRSPFHSDSVPETLRRVLTEEPPSISSSAHGVPPGLDGVLRRCMAKDREARTPSAAELAEELRELGEEELAGIADGGGRSRRQRVIIGGITGAVAVVVAAVLIWQWSRPTLAFTDHDRIVVADVENRTGDEAFDLALRTALETDLKQSPYATLYRRHQVEETLRRMRRSPDEVLDEDLGRDLCRFAGVRALIVPRIAEVDDGYLLEAAVVDPQTGRHAERIAVTAGGRDKVLSNAIDTLTREVRTRLGESLESIERTDFPIADVTTSSWEAMHYFALANVSWGRGDFGEAIRLYELALELDPEFATCRGSLGLLLIQFGGEPERGAEQLRQALVDGETLPRNEYLMLRAANRQFAERDLEGALEEYRLITDLYPRHSAARNNMGRVLLQLGRYEEAAAMFEKAVELDPLGTVSLVNLAFLYITVLPDAAAAEEIGRRLIAIDDEVANYHSLLGWSVAVQGRYDEAIEILERAVELEPNHRFALPNLGYVLLADGNPQSAVLYFRRNLARMRQAGEVSHELGGILDLVIALSAAGDRAGVERLVQEGEARIAEIRGDDPLTLDNHAFLAQLYAAAERIQEAEEHLSMAQSMEVDDAESQFELARSCAMLGRRECAIEGTRKAFDMGLVDPYLPMLIPSMHSLLGDPEFMKLFPGSAG